MEKLIEQAIKENNWLLVEQLHFLDFAMSEMILLEELIKG